LTLAYDHRAINGAVAGRFMHDLGLILADVRRLLI
jgi:pyruvate/2-oxoglutarate dehydrogenase complex dihydrolipoamide acyltransferase (E2) component